MKWIDLPPNWLLAFVVLGWVLAQIAGSPAPGVLRLLGGALAFIGIAFMVWGVLHMTRRKTTVIPHRRAATLVTDGPFHVSRNPIYLGDALFLAGAHLWWGLWWALPLVALFAWIITRRFILPEERRLRDDFGQAFGDYCAKTRRWI
ncbi:MAG: isoprenylcysteine carboxylmethyltransferase family protein [Pseudomonadota bacterium]